MPAPAYTDRQMPVPIYLDLLRAPTSICFAHVFGRLNRGDKFEDDIGHTDSTHNGASNIRENAVAKNNAADKDVDCAAD